VVPVALLVCGIVSMFARPFRAPLWVGPVAVAIVGVATTAIPWHEADDALGVLRDPLLFLVFAVPLAILLDRMGVFESLAAAVDGGRHLVAWLWVLGAAVTVVFNLDAAVVLLTPLYIRIAHRHRLPAEALAFQPALLACLASSPLPVSNLTNLIVAEQRDLGVGQFFVHLALPTLAACGIGWIAYRRCFPALTAAHATSAVDAPIDATALRRGLPIVGFVLVGFVGGDALGVAPWVVAMIATAWAALWVRQLPWRTVPYEAVLVAVGLAVLVAGAAANLRLGRLLDAGGIPGDLRALGLGAFGSIATNNLPAVLAAAPALHHSRQVWPLLIGVNMGPVLVLSGALSGLLWRDTARRLGVEVSFRRYSAVGVRVGLPAVLVAALVVVVL
jgi:arsenical pump membrane protein